MNTVILLLLLNAAHTGPVSASTFETTPAACAAYADANTVDDGFIVVCETRAEVQHDLAGGRCYINPTKPRLSNGAPSYICKPE